MELSKKTTILFPPDLHERLAALAQQRNSSIGELVRTACSEYYGITSKDDRLEAVKRLTELSLPVASVQEMKLQSVVSASELLP